MDRGHTTIPLAGPTRVGGVPALFHRVWIDDDGTDPIPDEFEEYWHALKRLHPAARFVTWGKTTDLWWMHNHDVYDACATHAGRSDVARYEIVARFGGVYLDTDVEPLRAFDDLLIDERPFMAWEDNRMLCPTVIGGPPEHPALMDLIEALGPWARQHRGQPPNHETGPYFTTARWRDRTDVRLLGSATFYPVHWSEKSRLGGPYPAESYAVHHWNASWLANGPPQRVP
jgi:mannosyltransferase OCH1-like enzyme